MGKFVFTKKLSIFAWIFKHLFLIELLFNLVKIAHLCYFISMTLYTHYRIWHQQNLMISQYNWYNELYTILKTINLVLSSLLTLDFQLGNDDLDDVIKYLELENHFSVQNKKTSECMFLCKYYFYLLRF